MSSVDTKIFTANGFSHLGGVKTHDGKYVHIDPPIQMTPGVTYCVDVSDGLIRVWQLISQCTPISAETVPKGGVIN